MLNLPQAVLPVSIGQDQGSSQTQMPPFVMPHRVQRAIFCEVSGYEVRTMGFPDCHLSALE
jgi:hypothetical protein